MTFVAVVLLGVGIVLLGSALDDTSVQATLTKIINNQPVDWSGTGQTSSVAKSGATAGGGLSG